MPDALTEPEPTSIASPCVRICRLNAQQMCIGCGRRLEEIARWLNYSEAERQTIMARLKAHAQIEKRAEDKTPQG